MGNCGIYREKIFKKENRKGYSLLRVDIGEKQNNYEHKTPETSSNIISNYKWASNEMS